MEGAYSLHNQEAFSNPRVTHIASPPFGSKITKTKQNKESTR